MQTIHRTTGNSKVIFSIQMSTQFPPLKSGMQLNFQISPKHSFPTKNNGLGMILREVLFLTLQIINSSKVTREVKQC